MQIKIRNLEALKAACRELGAELKEGIDRFVCYQTLNGNVQHCAYAIKIPGVNYEVGVQKSADGYSLAFDFYSSPYDEQKHDGKKLLEKFGPNCQKLVQYYGVAAATIEFQSKGMFVSRTQEANGEIRLTATGGGL